MTRTVGRLSWVVLLIGACAAGATSCKRRPPPDQTVEDGWSVARAALTDGQHCFAGKPEYCLTDPEIVDAAINKRLGELYGGEMPLRRAHVDATIRNAAILYKKAMMRPENVAKIEELVRERYYNPRVSTTDEAVSVDVGVVPGSLDTHPTTSSLSMMASALAPGGEWDKNELYSALASYASRYPDKGVIRIAVTVPAASLGTYSYRLLRGSGTVVVMNPAGELRTTRRNVISEASMKERSVSLRFADLTKCLPSRTPGPATQDPPHVCPPDDEHPSAHE